MIDFLMAGWHILPEQAYILCSVAMNLRLGQVVNADQITISAALRKSILPLLTAIEGVTAATCSTF
jgi:acetamidase/formamidase